MASLRSYCREVSTQQSIHVSFTHGDVPASIPMDISLCVYRIVQEALRNVARHSGANEAHVQLLTRDGGVCLRIADGGAGFDPDSIGHVGLGLISIRERLRFVGGELQVHSGRSHGTRLEVWIPLAAAGRTPPRPSAHPLSVLTGPVTLRLLVRPVTSPSSATEWCARYRAPMHTNQHAMLATPPVVGHGLTMRSCPSRLKVVAKAEARAAGTPQTSRSHRRAERSRRRQRTDAAQRVHGRLSPESQTVPGDAAAPGGSPGAPCRGDARGDGYGDCDRPWVFRAGSLRPAVQGGIRGVAVADASRDWPVRRRLQARRLTGIGDRDAMDDFPDRMPVAGGRMSPGQRCPRKPGFSLADDHTLLAEAFERLSVCGLRGRRAWWRTDANCWRPRLGSSRTSSCSTSRMPRLNGIDAGRQLKEKMRSVRLVFLTMNEDPEVAAEAFRIGASGYLLKRSALSELPLAIREVMNQRYYVTPLLTKGLVGSFDAHGSAAGTCPVADGAAAGGVAVTGRGEIDEGSGDDPSGQRPGPSPFTNTE